jgi:cell division protein FtsL
MVKKNGDRGGVPLLHRKYIVLVILLVAITVLYTWKKVEWASVAQRISNAEAQTDRLVEERSKLMAGIALRKRPGNIKKIAEDKLGMVYPAGRVVNLVLDAPEEGAAQ